MTRVLRDLHQDHINFTRLLTVLSEKLAALQDNRLTNFSLMFDVIDYLENYADLYHHPKEDLIYEFHLGCSDEARDIINHLRREHVNLKDLTGQLHRAIDGTLHGDILPKERLTALLTEFIERQLNHLKTEESMIFPMLEQSLGSKTWKRIDKIMPARIDPLFGENVLKQYEALYQRIR